MSNLPRVKMFFVRINLNGVWFDSRPMTLKTAENLQSELSLSGVGNSITVEEV